MARQPLVGLGFLCQVPWSHSDTPHSAGLLWMSDRPLAETSLYRTHTKLTTDNHAPGGIRTHNLNKWRAVGKRLRPRGHWDRHRLNTMHYNIKKKSFVGIITYYSSAESSIILWTLKYSVTKIENVMTCEELIKIPNPHMKNSIQQDGILISFNFSVLMT